MPKKQLQIKVLTKSFKTYFLKVPMLKHFGIARYCSNGAKEDRPKFSSNCLAKQEIYNFIYFEKCHG